MKHLTKIILQKITFLLFKDNYCVCVCYRSMVMTLCDPTDWSPPGSSVHGILQARILEWVSNFLLQGIFPTQGLKLCLLH